MKVSGLSVDDVNTQTVSERYNFFPFTSALLIYPEDVEKDDWLHNPDLKEEFPWTFWSTRGLLNCSGLFLVVFGLLALFIAYPVV
jgi:hypothetical protein